MTTRPSQDSSDVKLTIGRSVIRIEGQGISLRISYRYDTHAPREVGAAARVCPADQGRLGIEVFKEQVRRRRTFPGPR